MAQIRNFTSTNESYFVLDGVSYPKVYEAMLDNGYTKDRVKLVGTNRDNSPLVFSTHYSNIRVDGASFASANEAISRLNQVVFSKGGGSGGGGTTGDYIPLTGTEEGKPVTGDIYLQADNTTWIGEINNSYNILGKGIMEIVSGDEIYASSPKVFGLSSLLSIGTRAYVYPDKTEGHLVVRAFRYGLGDINVSKGLVGNEEFDKQGDRKAFAQLSDVYDSNSYSTNETKTGGTWIDGKPIYKKYITVDIPANNSNPVGYVMTNCTIIDFEKAYLKTLESDYAHAHGKGDNSIYDWSFSKNVTNGQLLVAPKTTHTTIRTVSGVLFYTKTTD